MWKSTIKRDHDFYGVINIFRQINAYSKEVTMDMDLISRNILSLSTAQCGKRRNSLSQIFVKAMVLLKKLLKS